MACCSVPVIRGLLYECLYKCVAISHPQVGDTALGMASMNGHQEVVRLLLQSGATDIPNMVRSSPSVSRGRGTALE